MDALIIKNTDSEFVKVEGSLRTFLKDTYADNWIDQVVFFKKKHGHNVKVAEVYFLTSHNVILYYPYLTETEQRQFIGFISDHITTSLYGQPFSLEMRE